MIARVIKIGLTAIFSMVTFVLFATTIYRCTWDYNENGVHFDEKSTMTYNDGAIVSYAFLTIVFFIPTILLWKSLTRIPSR
jgi:uncharacterized membrane protein YjgN (DUF898 family)